MYELSITPQIGDPPPVFIYTRVSLEGAVEGDFSTEVQVTRSVAERDGDLEAGTSYQFGGVGLVNLPTTIIPAPPKRVSIHIYAGNDLAPSSITGSFIAMRFA